MTPQLQHILDLLTPGNSVPPLTPAEALMLGKEYPFFTLPAVMALRDTPSADIPAEERDELMRQIALNSPDPVRTFMMADIDYSEWLDFYPCASRQVTTDDAISKFLETYGHSDPHEEALLERLIFNPTPDYSSVLERADREEGSPIVPPSPSDTPTPDDLINSFILAHRDDESTLLPHVDAPLHDEADTSSVQSSAQSSLRRQEHTVPAHAPGAFDSSLSESLAKIYIRQKRYDKAFEIIHTLSLNNPKKSSYFADQLRFLRKLMLNRSMTPPDDQSPA